MQEESDWVDNRWSRSDVGQFLASNLAVPGGRVMKALSIKVGDNDEGAVCFDTGQCALRAGWLGGFLKLDPARFGLINSPKISGEAMFSAPVGPGWLGLPAEPGRETQRCGGATGGSADLRGKHPEPWPIIDSSFRCLFKVGYKVNEWPTRANWGQLIRVANEYEPLHVAEVDSRDDRIEIIEGKH